MGELLRRWLPAMSCILLLAAVSPLAKAHGQITPAAGFQAQTLSDPAPEVFLYGSSIAYFDGDLFYAGADGKIYAFSVATGESTLVSDTSGLATLFSSVQGFFVGSDGYLYFHDNGNSAKIYRLALDDRRPAAYEELDTGVSSAIYGFAEHPTAGTVWFCSADFGPSHQFYLHEVNAEFLGVTTRAAFAKTKGDFSGNGPILFTEGGNELLYGESVFGGNGYFHRVDPQTGEVIEEDAYEFQGGLADAVRGFGGRIFVTTGGGKKVLFLEGSRVAEAAGTAENAQGLAFDGNRLFLSAMSAAGEVRFYGLSESPAADPSTGGGGGGGCFLAAAGPGFPGAVAGLALLLSAAALVSSGLVRLGKLRNGGPMPKRR